MKEQTIRGKMIPIYVGILAGADVAEFVPNLKDLIVALATQAQGWLREQVPILKDTLRMIWYLSLRISSYLCSKSTNKTPQVLNLLWDLIVHPANFVRACVATLFNGIVSEI